MQETDNTHAFDGQVECPNCGAAHAADDPRCPYCDALNPSGAEKAYMGALDDLKDDTGKLAQDAQRGFDASVRINAKRTAVIIIAAIAALTALFLTANNLDKQSEQREIQSYHERQAFREQHFAELDRLYETGDDRALSEYAWSLMDEPGFDALFTWEHVGYLEIYDDWTAVKFAEAEFKENDAGIDDYVWAVSEAIELARLDANKYRAASALSEDEEARAAAYRASGLAFLESTLQMNEEEVTRFAATVLDADGRVDDALLKRELEPRLKQLGTIGQEGDAR